MIKTLFEKIVNYCKQCIEYCNKTIYPYDYFIDKYDTKSLAIKANMGIGKTKELRNFCNNFEKIIIVTFRVSLGEEFMNKFKDFHFYKDSTGIIDTSIYNKVIVQIDSLYRIEGSCDLLVLDECQYTLLQLVQSKYREKSFNSLLSYIKNTEYFISIDALFNEDIINYIYKIRNDLVFIENTYKLHYNKKVLNYKNNIGLFEKTMFDNLKNNKKIIICTNSRKYLRALEKRIRDIYIDKNILMYDGVKDYKLNLDDWDKADIIGYTPTIVAGISYEKHRFDEVYGYFINSSSPAEMSIQQLFRVRNLKDNNFHICADVVSDNDYPVELEDIENCLKKRHNKLIMYSNTINIDNYHKEIIKDEYFDLFINIAKIINLSKNKYEKRLIYLLETQGIKSTYINIDNNIKELNKSTRKIINSIKKDIELIEDKDIIESELIDEVTYKERNNLYSLSYKQKCEMKLFTFINNYKFKGKPSLEEYNKFKKLYKQYSNLCIVNANKENIYNTLEEKIKFRLEKYSKNNIKILHNNFRFEKIFLLNQFIKSLGYESIFDKNEININFDNFYKEIKFYESDIYSIWNINKDNRFNNHENIKDRNKIILRFLNERLLDLYKIKIIKNKENKYYINGLEIWDKIKYNTEEIREEIVNKHQEEKDSYEVDLLIKNLIN
jgi:hypothetical protein